MYRYTKVSHLVEAPEALLETSKMKDVVFPLLRTFRCKVGVQKEVLENDAIYSSSTPHTVYEVNRKYTNIIRLYLYQEDCPLAFGFLDYGQPMHRSSTEMFYISSPNVENNRYSWSSIQRNFAMAKDADKMLKKAQRYFRLLKPKDVAEFFWCDRVMQLFNHEKYEKRTEIRNARGRISSHDWVVEELEHLYKSGHTFLSSRVADDVASLIKLTTEASLPENQRSGRINYIYIRKDGLIDAVEFDADEYSRFNNVTIPTELPEETVRRVTALTMCKNGQHVNGVGTRVNDNCFYVYA